MGRLKKGLVPERGVSVHLNVPQLLADRLASIRTHINRQRRAAGDPSRISLAQTRIHALEAFCDAYEARYRLKPPK